MNDEEVAFRIVRLYFEDVARLGFKRQLDLDQMINAYFYVLKKIKNKDVAMKKIVEDMKKEMKETKVETTVTTSAVPVVKETTTTTTVTTQDPKTISDILEK
jgi:TPP-dependent 2-oxoacid decarboxylase